MPEEAKESSVDEAQDRKLVETLCRQFGLIPDDWVMDDDDDRIKAMLGRWGVLQEDEDRGMFEGDEGVLWCTAVGAVQYQNLQAKFYWRSDDAEVGEQVVPFDDIEPLDR